MAELPTYFADFLSEIRLTKGQADELKAAHTELRDLLWKDEDLSKILIETFLQGSYRRSTIVRPEAGARADVDVIVVTNLDRHIYTPQQALGKFRPFLERNYPGRWRLQGRSIGIEFDSVDLDLVVTSAPSEVAKKALQTESVRSMATLEEAGDWRLNAYWVSPERREMLEARSRMWKAAQEPEWKTEPLWIPDREAKEWQPTHPLAQFGWTLQKNARTNKHFVNVVKALKWWRRKKHPRPEHPKGYPLERIIAECCPDGIGSVAFGITTTLEDIVNRFAGHSDAGTTPDLRDYGVDQDVLHRLTAEDFVRFYEQVTKAATRARQAYEEPDTAKSATQWRELLGEEFPRPPEGRGASGGPGGSAAIGGYTERKDKSVPGSGRFA